MVTSARGPSAADIRHFGAAARAIRTELPDVELCVSLGIMGDAEAESLRASGIDFVNHNLNTSQRFYPEICTTHTYEDRVATVRSARRAGLSACSGVIVGLGETDDDLVDVAFALAELGVESLPVNFLIPIDGTTLTTGDPPSIGRCLRSLVLFRLTNPRAEIRAAGGRERNLGGAQSLALFAANSVFVDGYLTTAGQAHRDAALHDRDSRLRGRDRPGADGQRGGVVTTRAGREHGRDERMFERLTSYKFSTIALGDDDDDLEDDDDDDLDEEDDDLDLEEDDDDWDEDDEDDDEEDEDGVAPTRTSFASGRSWGGPFPPDPCVVRLGFRTRRPSSERSSASGPSTKSGTPSRCRASRCS